MDGLEGATGAGVVAMALGETGTLTSVFVAVMGWRLAFVGMAWRTSLTADAGWLAIWVARNWALKALSFDFATGAGLAAAEVEGVAAMA